MTPSPPFDGLSEVRAAVTADPQGRVLAATAGARIPADAIATVAAVVRELSAAGSAFGLAHLGLLVVKGPAAAMLAGVRTDGFLLVSADPFRATKAIETVLSAWSQPGAGDAATQPPAAVAPTTPPAAGSGRGHVAAEAAPAAPAATRAARPAAGEPPSCDAWAALRRALVRGHLTEAVACQRDLGAPAPPGPRRPGSEPVSADECDRAVRALLEGVGSVMAGDGVGGDRILRALAAPSQPNLSFRWLALHWSARAALKRGSFPTARAHVKESLDLGRQLDMEARAVSQWIAAEVLAHDRDPARALAWLAESRGRFERLGDGWGLAHTWLAEARILAVLEREDEAAAAARRASASDPAWDEPQIFLARRALLRDDLSLAEELLRTVCTPAADRVRVLIEAIQQGKVGRADAAEFLREHDAPPSARAIAALARIAGTSPRFPQAREALAWMLLKVGKYADAGGLFRALLSQQLSPGDRASVMLGLGCIANARQGAEPAALQTLVGASPASEGSPAERPSSSSILARAQQAASGGTESVFSGRLSEFALPDLLEFLRTARRTGLLVCSTQRGMGALRFRDGRITGAASPATPGVGELLVRARKVAPPALRALVPAGAAPPDHAVGELLVREGLVDAAAVMGALEQQIAITIRELVSWTEGEFAFSREAEGDAQPELAVSVDPQAVLLEVFKDLDEAARGPVETGAKP
jgi:tetratricopeptide (TPR) repeat protein